jgi:hypothetical protein
MPRNFALSFAAHSFFLSLCNAQLSVSACAQDAQPHSPAVVDGLPGFESDNQAPGADTENKSSERRLVAGVTVFEPHCLLGKWNGHVSRFGRHPKLYIDYCQDGRIAGLYKGIFGKFPVSGYYNDQSGDITINVDFSSSALTKFRKLKSGHGVIQANIKDDILVGRASIPDLGRRTVRWEAVKEKCETSITTAGDVRAE